MENVELKLVQERELGILREILKVINKYHLRYYMLGGTLLGEPYSVQHCHLVSISSACCSTYPISLFFKDFHDGSHQGLISKFCLELGFLSHEIG